VFSYDRDQAHHEMGKNALTRFLSVPREVQRVQTTFQVQVMFHPESHLSSAAYMRITASFKGQRLPDPFTCSQSHMIPLILNFPRWVSLCLEYKECL